MNSKVGRCTAVYESKDFPFFTINKAKDICAGNYGGVLAFYERLKFVQKHQRLLELAGVVVTGDCEFLCEDQSGVDFLLHFMMVFDWGPMVAREPTFDEYVWRGVMAMTWESDIDFFRPSCDES